MYGAAMTGQVKRITRHSNELMIGTLGDLADYARHRVGGGMLYQATIPTLDMLTNFPTRRDQTLTHFGLDEAALRALAVDLNGRGIDRIVPVGEALAFGRVWDGYDLLASLGRRVVIRATPTIKG